MNDDTGADKAGAARVDETGGEEVEVKLGLDAVDVGNDGVSGVVTTGASCADVHLTGKNIGKLSLALVTPLGSEQDRGLAARLGVGGFWHCSHGESGEKSWWKRSFPKGNRVGDQSMPRDETQEGKEDARRCRTL